VKTKMLAGELYMAGGSELAADAARARAWMARYNAPTAPRDERHAMLSVLFAQVGEGAYRQHLASSSGMCDPNTTANVWNRIAARSPGVGVRQQVEHALGRPAQSRALASRNSSQFIARS
jgi:hypothetical protein